MTADEGQLSSVFFGCYFLSVCCVMSMSLSLSWQYLLLLFWNLGRATSSRLIAEMPRCMEMLWADVVADARWPSEKRPSC